MQKKITNNFIIILIGFLVGIAFILPIISVKAANITFDADTTLTFSPDASPVISVKSGSTADTATISGTVLTVDTPAGSTFTLKNSNGDLLGITPSGGKSILQVDASTDYNSSLTDKWSESSSAGPTVAHTVTVGAASSWYRITADGVTINHYQSDSSSVVTFTYALGVGTTSFAVSSATGALGGGSGSGGTPIVGGGGTSSSQPVTTIQQTTTPSRPVAKISQSELIAKILAAMKILGIKAPAGISSAPLTIPDALTPPIISGEIDEQIISVVLKRGLSIGSRGEDVKTLQQLLKDEGEDIYPEGIVSGYFGRLTKLAVQRFQEKYEIAKKGVAGYGYVGPKTRAKINELLGL